jgi:hypothetical protein
MSYAGAVELMRNTAEVNRVIEVFSSDELEGIEAKLKGEDWAVEELLDKGNGSRWEEIAPVFDGLFPQSPLGAIRRKHFIPTSATKGSTISLVGPIQSTSNLFSIMSTMHMFDSKNTLQQFPGWDCRMWPAVMLASPATALWSTVWHVKEHNY